MAVPTAWQPWRALIILLQCSFLSRCQLRPCEEERLGNATTENYGSFSNTGAELKLAGLDAIYVTHYTPYHWRRKNLEQRLDQMGLKATFILSWDRDNVTDEDVACMYPSDKVFASVATKRKFPVSWLSNGELGLAMKHAAAYYDAVQKGHRNILVLEDDAVFAPDFVSKLLGVLRSPLLTNYGVVFLGSYWPVTDDELQMQPEVIPDDGNKGAVGYLVSASGARHLMDHMPIQGPADHEISNREYSRPPPNRFKLDPFIIWQGSRAKDWWANNTDQHTVVKGSRYLKTNDTGPCVGCNCPDHVRLVSPHMVERDPNPRLAALLPHLVEERQDPSLAVPAILLRRGRSIAQHGARRQWLDSKRAFATDPSYISMATEANYAGSAAGVVEYENSLL